MRSLEDRIFNIETERDFEALCMEVFNYQVEHVKPYAEYIHYVGIDHRAIKDPGKIPFLPIEFFKTHHIIADGLTPAVIFESSGTTGSRTSKHYVASIDLYERSFTTTFNQFYGSPSDYCILALLPSYLERQNSSLLYMTDRLIRLSNHSLSGFYLSDLEGLSGTISSLEKMEQKYILFGVTFALVDLARRHPQPIKQGRIIETGGMKGRRPEMTRMELHQLLTEAYFVESIDSEYGMTELLSQAYSEGGGIFRAPSWMKISARDPYDPLNSAIEGRRGGLNIIDLANLYSCSFIATSDLGRVFSDGSFTVEGRFDQADVRGCNLLV